MGDNQERLDTLRHSASHIMAEAVRELFPQTKFAIGPAIENGFYYDFELPRALVPEDLAILEKKMKEITQRKLPFVSRNISKEEARRIFLDQPYKLEIIDELEGENITIYTQGEFTDLCRGPHVANTKEVCAFKLTSIAGAYWRGDEHNAMLQRIYGTAFESEAELDAYLVWLEEAARRDHRRLGKELDIYSVHKEIGPGLVCWHPAGGVIRSVIEDFWRDQHRRRGYDLVYTPHIANVGLWKTSGHWDFYRENLYSPMDIDGEEYIIKPMNCVFHIKIYQTHMHSYRELPLRYAELGTVYRYERSGALHGLSRVRGFTQDDAHIFCRPDQLEAEVAGVLELAGFMIKTFGFDKYKMMLSTRPEKAVGSPEVWERATSTLASALEKQGLSYEVDPGEGVFYGPKIDIKFEDAMGRLWQGPTIQVDFNMPDKFGVNYIGEDGEEHRAVMVHRTVLGSMERFVSCLLENYAGAFPVWLSPVQTIVLPIADRHAQYARQVSDLLKVRGVRTELNASSETINKRIRAAQVTKVPYMLVLGDREAAAQTVSVRLRNGVQIPDLPLGEFMEKLGEKIANRSLDIAL